MEKKDIFTLLKNNAYPGRGILIGKSGDGARAVIAYFIMGRSENSRNRVFTARDDGIITEAADISKLRDPSLIIYAPVRVHGNDTIVTNGDQTDTIYEALAGGSCFIRALRTRTFEPDSPNFTPRISGIVHVAEGKMTYRLSILKTDGENTAECLRYFYEYAEPVAGEGRFISTYLHDGSPIPSFEGEPVRVGLDGSPDEFAETLWASLNPDNKVSLFVRCIDLASGAFTDRIVNKYQKI